MYLFAEHDSGPNIEVSHLNISVTLKRSNFINISSYCGVRESGAHVTTLAEFMVKKENSPRRAISRQRS